LLANSNQNSISGDRSDVTVNPVIAEYSEACLSGFDQKEPPRGYSLWGKPA